MEFEIDFYNDIQGKSPIEEFLDQLKITHKILWKQALKGIEKLRNRVYHKEPLSKHLESGLWELRIKAGTDILRVIYTFRKRQIIILLHVFIKKEQKTPAGELEIARKRLKEIKFQEAN
jgi:phage-related protein